MYISLFSLKTLNSVFYVVAGEGGRPVHISENDDPQVAPSKKAYGINMPVSDRIAMNRTLPDTRMDE